MMIISATTYDKNSPEIMWDSVTAASWSAAEIHLSVMTCKLPLDRVHDMQHNADAWSVHLFRLPTTHAAPNAHLWRMVESELCLEKVDDQFKL